MVILLFALLTWHRKRSKFSALDEIHWTSPVKKSSLIWNPNHRHAASSSFPTRSACRYGDTQSQARQTSASVPVSSTRPEAAKRKPVYVDKSPLSRLWPLTGPHHLTCISRCLCVQARQLTSPNSHLYFSSATASSSLPFPWLVAKSTLTPSPSPNRENTSRSAPQNASPPCSAH